MTDMYSVGHRDELYAAWREFTCLNTGEYAAADTAMDKFFEQHDMEVREETRQEAFTDGYGRGYDDGHSEGERYVYDHAWDDPYDDWPEEV